MRIEFAPYTARESIKSLIDRSSGIKYLSISLYRDSDIWINTNQSVPFVLKNDVIQWRVPLTNISLLDVYITFGEKAIREGLYIEDTQLWGENSIETKTTVDYFLKFLTMKQKKWKIGYLKYKGKHVLKEFIRNTNVGIRNTLEAIYLRTSYTIDVFSQMFSIDFTRSKILLQMLGYECKKTNEVYVANEAKIEDVHYSLDLAFSHQNEYTDNSGFKGRIFRRIGSYLRILGDNIAYPYSVNMIKDEPVYKKKHDFARYVILSIIFFVGLILGILFYKKTLPNNIDGWNILNQLYSTLIITGISSFVTVITTVLIIHRSYNVDYHQERMSSLPILRVINNDNHFDINNPPRHIESYIKSEGYINFEYPDDTMLLKIKNVGKGMAFKTCISQGILHDGEFYLSSLGNGDERYLVIRYCREMRIKFEFRDIYGNLYYQNCEGNMNYNGDKMWFQMEPPELVRRTNRARYVQ